MEDYLHERMPLMPQNFVRVNVSNFSANILVMMSCHSNASPLSSSSSSHPSFSRLNTIRLVVDVGIVGVLCLFGFIGSTLTIVTLRFDKDKNNTTTWLLQVLAVVDILYLATCVVIQPLNTSKMLGLWHTSYDVLLIQLHVDSYTWFLASVMQTIMIWVVILVTADRYLAICKPLNCHKLRTIQKCRVAVSGVVVLAVLYNIPLLFEHKVVYSLNQCTGSPQARLDLTYLRNDPLYFLVYKTLCHLTFRSLGPLLILIVLNGKLIAALRRLRIRRRSLTRSCTPGDNVTLMLVAVVSVFVVCELPDCCLRLSVTLIDYAAFLYNEEAVRTANVFVNMLHTFNSSVNFLIYCLVGRKFRRILVGICCGTTADRLTQEDDVELRVTTNQSAGNNALYEMC